ncbi:hypothetical protein EWM64_g8769 [Hericium alpestre]|uniref:THH1/TOM1/TOM3 domain-containing protein n=1 Tax=Hericium alpestre TaxID=135208 RepID=A0A4Y9ZMP3_9AGAM|nr:hypothetical protein EWM64_g8769 [Hericium alpestre]
MATFNIAEAHLVALFLESLFYGIFLVTFGQCILALTRSRRTPKQKSTFFVITLFFFLFGTLDIAFLMRQILEAFIYYDGPGGANTRLEDISDWVNVMRTVFYCVQTSIADGMLIYRCWIVYGRKWAITAGLSIVWLACIICEIFTCYIEFTLHQSAALNAKDLTPFITSVLATTLGLNLIATSMIVWKIWSIHSWSYTPSIASRVHDTSSHDALRHAIRVVIESGAMYSASIIVFFVVYLAGSNGQYAASDCAFQIIGIAFNLIIIRVEQGRTIEAAGTMYSTSTQDGVSRNKSLLPVQFRMGASSTVRSGDSDHPLPSAKPAKGRELEEAAVIELGDSTSPRVKDPCVNMYGGSLIADPCTSGAFM